MPSYAIALLRRVTIGQPIMDYLQGIDETLAPFGGHFLVHGNPMTRMEGNWPQGDLIIIAFPDRASLDGWYKSPAYQRILSLRIDNSEGDVVFVDGVTEPHRAVDVLG
jgi:uncharacterized protein (DUF1330 family)